MFFKTDALGNKIPAYAGGELPYFLPVTGATTLRVEDSGKIVKLNGATGAVITLPAVTAPWAFRVYTGLAFATTNWTVVSATNVIQGGAIVNSTFVPAVNENTISFVASAETVGDYVDIVCDGAIIYVNGVGASAGSITFTAP